MPYRWILVIAGDVVFWNICPIIVWSEFFADAGQEEFDVSAPWTCIQVKVFTVVSFQEISNETTFCKELFFAYMIETGLATKTLYWQRIFTFRYFRSVGRSS